MSPPDAAGGSGPDGVPPVVVPPVVVRRSPWSRLDPATLHDIVRLRVDVFVVEQACPYAELDGRDTEPGTEHVWTSAPGVPVAAYVRVLTEAGGAHRIGRVVTHPQARGLGLAGHLVADAVARRGDGVLVLDAQRHLADWYGRLGFAVAGQPFVEDGIPHVPMRREPTGAASTDSGHGGGAGDGPGAGGGPLGQGGAMAAHPPESPPDDDLDPAEPVVDPAADDPDVLAASSQLDERDDPGALATDGLEPDADEDGWQPPGDPGPVTDAPDAPTVDTPATLDDRLAQEEPEVDPMDAGRSDADHDLRET